MKALGQTVMLSIMLGIVGAIVAPTAIIALSIMDTWNAEFTGQLLGGFIAVCGAGVVLVGVMVGCGLFARLSGWRAPRQMSDSPRELPTIEGQWRALPPAPDMLPSATGGGRYELLPPQQDRRFSMDVPRFDKRTGV